MIQHVFPLVFLDCGQILSCGSNAFGQLGIETTVKQSADVNLVEVRLFPSGRVPFNALLPQMQPISSRRKLLTLCLVIVRA